MGMTAKAPEINVTPMIDVLLVLIIIFMLVSPQSRGLDVSAPTPAPRDDQTHPANNIVVTVCADDSVRLNREQVALADVPTRLAALYQGHPEGVLFVRAEGKLEYRQMARAIDLARGAGVARVALMPR
jgi:biopolymer transport protein TolR